MHLPLYRPWGIHYPPFALSLGHPPSTLCPVLGASSHPPFLGRLCSLSSCFLFLYANISTFLLWYSSVFYTFVCSLLLNTICSFFPYKLSYIPDFLYTLALSRRFFLMEMD